MGNFWSRSVFPANAVKENLHHIVYPQQDKPRAICLLSALVVFIGTMVHSILATSTSQFKGFLWDGVVDPLEFWTLPVSEYFRCCYVSSCVGLATTMVLVIHVMCGYYQGPISNIFRIFADDNTTAHRDVMISCVGLIGVGICEHKNYLVPHLIFAWTCFIGFCLYQYRHSSLYQKAINGHAYPPAYSGSLYVFWEVDRYITLLSFFMLHYGIIRARIVATQKGWFGPEGKQRGVHSLPKEIHVEYYNMIKTCFFWEWLMLLGTILYMVPFIPVMWHGYSDPSQ